MGDPKAFLTIGRSKIPKRPVDERLHDYRQVYKRVPELEIKNQAARCMDCGVPFCNTGCPVHNLIPEWNDLAFRGEWREAIDRLHLTNNFPEFTGTLCPAPCESACVLSINDHPVNIKEVERSIIDRAFDEGWVVPLPPQSRTDKRVAIVGSGPAGLAAAQQLNRAGHNVTVYERDDVVGGLLTYGIPDFKIEKTVVARRIQQMVDEGVEFRTGVHIGTDITMAELRDQNDAVLLAVGALQGRDADVPGRQLPGIHMAMDYLTQQNRRVAGLAVEGETITANGKHVVIVGGGDTGADCLGNVHREGALSVKVITRGSEPPSEALPGEWPAVPNVLRTWPAHEEGGTRYFDVQVRSFVGEDLVSGIRVGVDDGTEEELPADLVLLAIGFSGPVQDDLFEEIAPTMSNRGAIAVDDAYATDVEGVFAAGDAMRGASLVVWAIADGRQAAASIESFLTR